MAKAITIVLFIVILGLVALPAHTFPVCQGPPHSFKSYVGQKQKKPPRLSVVPGPQDESPCTSPVAASVTEEPSWQVLKVQDGVQINLDDNGTIVALRKIPGSVIPHVVKEAARKQGLEVE